MSATELDHIKMLLVDRHQTVILKDMIGPVDIVGIKRGDHGEKVAITAKRMPIKGMTRDEIIKKIGTEHKNDYVAFYELRPDDSIRFGTVPLNTFA